MSAPTLEEALGQLPAYRAFSETLARSAMDGRHLLILTGGQLEPSLLKGGLDGALVRLQGPVLQTVPLAECGADESPPAFLSRVTGLSEEHLTPAPNSLAPKGFLPVHDLLWLEGLEQLREAAAARWLHFFRLCAHYGGMTSHMFALPLRRLTQGLADQGSDTRLALHHWWGRLSHLDIQMLCRLGNAGPVDAPQSLWREAILPHLVDGSANLARKLWDSVLEPEATLLDALKGHARAQHFEPGALRETVAKVERHRADQRQTEAPSPVWQMLWEMGAAQCSAEQGPELTTLALTQLDRLTDVRNRLWRGQAALLLPRLTRLRVSICQELTNKNGRTWPTRLGAAFMDDEQKRRVEADPLATEFGPLELILQWRPECGGQKYLAIVQRARWMRNQLAHNQTVSFGDFVSLYEMQQRLGLVRA